MRTKNQRHVGSTCRPSFALFPVGTDVTFRSGHAHAHLSGVVVSYEVLRLLSYLGEVPRVRLLDGSECFATKPDDLQLLKEPE